MNLRVDPPYIVVSMPLEEYMDSVLVDLRDKLADIARDN